MKKLKNVLIIGILCVIAFWVGLYAFRTQKPPTPPPTVSTGGGTPGHVGLQEINFVQVKDGVRLWELKAEEVEYQQPKNLVSFKKVALTYFPKGEKPISLVGNLGQLDTQTKNVTIEGEVIISTPEGYELKVPSLYYNNDKREVSSEEVFTFKGPDISLDGQGMAMNLDSQKVWVKKKARVTFHNSFFKS
ncbi:MAG: LPS export ABC transporter periplasmic protein LptC [Deltaproteobacteria bacterium RBG_13_43_22]|nr:MAG: LPS export ABC transporter periplasmic protein LptC [Deltaproteobacteria bacterium RBG_13_43_22]